MKGNKCDVVDNQGRNAPWLFSTVLFAPIKLLSRSFKRTKKSLLTQLANVIDRPGKNDFFPSTKFQKGKLSAKFKIIYLCYILLIFLKKGAAFLLST